MAGLHSAGSVVFVEPHGCFDPEDLSSRSERFILVGFAFFSAELVGATQVMGCFRRQKQSLDQISPTQVKGKTCLGNE